MKVIYCDNHLLVVEKPAGIATQPDLHEMAKEWLKKKYGKPGKVFLEPIHRLDRPVGGIVLLARTSKALSRLQEAMRKKEIRKIYYALVDPLPPLESATLEHFLLHGDHRAHVVPPSHEGGKRASLTYRHVGKGLLEIVLETGRYHQIRAQLSCEGFPIVGDKKYGSSASWKEREIALHHGKLEFVHPVTREDLCFVSLPRYALEILAP